MSVNRTQRMGTAAAYGRVDSGDGSSPHVNAGAMVCLAGGVRKRTQGEGSSSGAGREARDFIRLPGSAFPLLADRNGWAGVRDHSPPLRVYTRGALSGNALTFTGGASRAGGHRGKAASMTAPFNLAPPFPFFGLRCFTSWRRHGACRGLGSVLTMEVISTIRPDPATW